MKYKVIGILTLITFVGYQLWRFYKFLTSETWQAYLTIGIILGFYVLICYLANKAEKEAVRKEKVRKITTKEREKKENLAQIKRSRPTEFEEYKEHLRLVKKRGDKAKSEGRCVSCERSISELNCEGWCNACLWDDD